MKEILVHSFLHSLEECAAMLPILFLSYLIVEYAEHKMNSRTKDMIYRAGKAGPLIGGLIGLIPQCGFAAAAAGLFAGGMISPGTLLAVFLATSDEMLPIMISGGIGMGMIGKILTVKAVVGITAGFLFDAVLYRIRGPRERMKEQTEMCENDGCGCSGHGIVWPAVYHTIHTTLFLLVVSVLVGIAMEWFEATGTMGQLIEIAGLESMVCGLAGMVPNCAASVLITKLFIEGMITPGAMFAGLLCGAGTGLLVMFRESRNVKKNLIMTGILYATGVCSGIVIGLLEII